MTLETQYLDLEEHRRHDGFLRQNESSQKTVIFSWLHKLFVSYDNRYFHLVTVYAHHVNAQAVTFWVVERLFTLFSCFNHV